MKKDFYILISTLVIAILLWLLYSINNNFNKVQNDLDEMTIERNSKGELIVSQNQKIMSMEDAMKVLKKSKNVSKINQQTQFGTKTIIVEKKIPFEVEKIRYIDTNTLDTFEWMKLPYTFIHQDSWSKLEVTIDPLDITIDTMYMNNNFTVSVGEKSNGLFKKPTPIVEIKSDNPYTNVTSVKNVTIDTKKPFYKTFWFGGIVGALTMLLIL